MRFITMMGTAALTMTATTFGRVTINEIRTGSSNAEYVEFAGAPGTSMEGMTFLIIGDGTSTGATPSRTGVVEWKYTFPAGTVIGANGFLVLHNPGDATNAFPFTVDPNSTNLPWPLIAGDTSATPATNTQIEGSDNQTYLLVTGYSGSDTWETRAPVATNPTSFARDGSGGQDLDTNDDGTLDLTPWTAVVDSVSLKETNGSAPLAGQDWWYSANVCGPYISRTTVSATSGTTVAGWDFQTTTNGGTATALPPNTPKSFTANFGAGVLSLNGTNGSSDWYVGPTSNVGVSELDCFTGTATGATSANGFSTTTTLGALCFAGGKAPPATVAPTSNGKALTLKFSMASLAALNVQYATQRSSSGYTSQQWAWSVNGSDWTNIDLLTSTGTGNTLIPTSFGLRPLAVLNALDGAPDAYLKITFDGATTGSGGTRIDNLWLFTSPSTTESVVTTYGAPVHAIRQASGWAMGPSSTAAGVALDTVGAANYVRPTYTCGDANAGDCAATHDNGFCANACCCAYVCGLDPYCCDVRWDAICVTKQQGCAAACSAPPCPADFNQDHVVDGADLGLLLGGWGAPDKDLNNDGVTDGADLGLLLGAWGACP